jgi:hypothetical protein
MPVNGFTVGRDINVVINGQGEGITLEGITDFNARPLTTTIKTKPLHGKPQHAYIPDGWEISIKIDRRDASVDDFWNSLENEYYNGDNLPAGTIIVTISNSDGSISKYRYEDTVLKVDNPGDFSGDKIVQQSLSGMASSRTKVK